MCRVHQGVVVTAFLLLLSACDKGDGGSGDDAPLANDPGNPSQPIDPGKPLASPPGSAAISAEKAQRIARVVLSTFVTTNEPIPPWSLVPINTP